DYESLRIGGMIFAVILFLMGIFLIVSECQTICVGNAAAKGTSQSKWRRKQ
uniref:FXYD domain-containing ion transport regulator n=1 Tax=Sinocyclocheilus anshuiensis TaxID=1608454 RepID=A0A671M075_9TELE